MINEDLGKGLTLKVYNTFLLLQCVLGSCRKSYNKIKIYFIYISNIVEHIKYKVSCNLLMDAPDSGQMQ